MEGEKCYARYLVVSNVRVFQNSFQILSFDSVLRLAVPDPSLLMRFKFDEKLVFFSCFDLPGFWLTSASVEALDVTEATSARSGSRSTSPKGSGSATMPDIPPPPTRRIVWSACCEASSGCVSEGSTGLSGVSISRSFIGVLSAVGVVAGSIAGIETPSEESFCCRRS